MFPQITPNGPHKTHFDVESFIKILKGIFVDNVIIKNFFAFVALYFAWVFDANLKVLLSVYLLICFDALTGVLVALKEKTISSRGFYRSAVKCVVYFIMLLVGRIVDKQTPIQLAAPILDTYLIITEAISILENISKLGFPVPKKIVEKLNIFNGG